MLPKLAVIVALLIFTFSGGVSAEENTQHGNGHFSIQHQMQMPDGEMPNMTPEEHQIMMNHETGGDSQTSGGHESGHGSGHGMEKEFVETLPNWPVLGAFAVINLGFILIGIWNKWTKRKEVA